MSDPVYQPPGSNTPPASTPPADGIEAHLRSLAGGIGGPFLPPHYPTCLGCGPQAQSGFHLRVSREGDQMRATHTFLERQSGAPGVAHGGAVATVVDDMLGFLLYVARVPGVTRSLTVDYLTPVLLGVPYDMRARLDRRDGRKLWMSCEGTAPEGAVAFRGAALFLAVDVQHFRRVRASGDGQQPVAP